MSPFERHGFIPRWTALAMALALVLFADSRAVTAQPAADPERPREPIEPERPRPAEAGTPQPDAAGTPAERSSSREDTAAAPAEIEEGSIAEQPQTADSSRSGANEPETAAPGLAGTPTEAGGESAIPAGDELPASSPDPSTSAATSAATSVGPASDGPASDGPASDGPASDGPASDGPTSAGPASDTAASNGGTSAGDSKAHSETEPEPSAATTEPRALPIIVSTGIADLVPKLPTWARGNVPLSLLLFVVFLLLAWLLRKVRTTLPTHGALPTALWVAAFIARIGLVATVLLLLAGIFRPIAEGAYPWLLAAAALAIGWSLRDVLPDVTAAIVLRLENRLKPGVWISGDSYEGVIERRAFRALWLRDPHGDLLAIPNRAVLAMTVHIQDDAGAIHDVALRLPSTGDASKARSAILEAVLTSPYVAAQVGPAIRRDGQDPDLWRVRARLLHERYAIHFEGELLERVESALSYRAPEVTN